MKNAISIFPLLFIGLLPLVGCSDTVGPLEDRVWVLEFYGSPDNLQRVLTGTAITAEFKGGEGQVVGSAGCNRYFGGYEVRGDKLTVSGPIGRTEMYCGDTINEQERSYLETLQVAQSYSIENGSLTVNCGNRVLVFKLTK